MDIILSIKPKYAELILTGKKRYELRRVFLAREFETVYLYSTSPVQMVTGKFTVKKIHRGIPLNELWETVKTGCSLTRQEFDKYFNGKDKGTAIEIDEYTVIPTETLSNFGDKDKNPIETPPQNYCYTCGPVNRSIGACIAEIEKIRYTG